MIIKALLSLPKITELKIDSLSVEELQIIAYKIPKLQIMSSEFENEHFEKQNLTFSPRDHLQENSQENIEIQEIDPIETEFRCLEYLFREKQESYELDRSELKQRLSKIIEMFHNGIHVNQMKSLETKTDAEMNWFVLEKLSEYVRDYVDPRIALVIQAVTDRNKSICDSFYENILMIPELEIKLQKSNEKREKIVLEKNELALKINRLQEELNEVRKKNVEKKTNQIRPESDENENNPLQNHFKIPKDKALTRRLFFETINRESKDRFFTVSQVKSIINDLTKSKIKKDNNFLLAELSFVTMKEHMNNYFQKKFGIKNWSKMLKIHSQIV